MATCGTWSGWRQRPKRGPQREFILHHQRQVTQASQATLHAGSNYSGAEGDGQSDRDRQVEFELALAGQDLIEDRCQFH